MDATFAALLGAVVGGLLSVLASWLAQRVQSNGQWLSQEILRRQQIYSEFVESGASCFADALQYDEPNTETLAKLYGDIGRIRINSSKVVVREAYRIAHKILEVYGDQNRSKSEIRDFLARDSVDLFSDFGDACRVELKQLRPHRIGVEDHLDFRIMPDCESKGTAATKLREVRS